MIKKAYQTPTSQLLQLHFEGMLAASDSLKLNRDTNVDDSEKSAAREFEGSAIWGTYFKGEE